MFEENHLLFLLSVNQKVLHVVKGK